MAKHKKNNRGNTVMLIILGLIGLGVLTMFLLQGTNVALFNPKGLIADEQRQLMLIATMIMVGFAVPILFLLYFFAWKYRESNAKATYHAEPKHRHVSAVTLWVLPTIMMLILASLMVPATYRLKPQKQIISDKKTLNIQVVALRWKWLFIYPEQNIATVNYIELPVNTPVEFDLTADETPMSSFWIPNLGGQLYAMTGHVNRLNLLPEEIGEYEGSTAEINGSGFAGMRFITKVSTQASFDAWAQKAKDSPDVLSIHEYQDLLKPSKDEEAAFYSTPEQNLYSTILSKYTGSSQHYSEDKGNQGH